MSRRKAEMVLKLVDKATRPARRFIAMQKRMGRAAELANRVSQRSASAAKRATDLYTRAVGRLDRAQDALRANVRRTNQVIAKQTRRLRSSGAMMRNGALGMGRAAVVAGGLWAAYSGTVSAAGAAMLSPARQFERFQTVLTTTEGSAKAAQESMKWVEDFATRTPYELDQVMASFVQLRAYGLDPTNGMLKSLGNASAAMNKPLMQSVEAMADAVTGENERLKELGIKAAKVGQYFEYSYTGKDGSDKVVRALASDRQAIQAAILGIFNEKYDGSMDNLSKTFDGMFSNVLDQWSKFQRMIMGFGVFDWMKSKLKLVLDEINRLEASGELEQWAKAIADHILIGLEAIWSFGSRAVEFWQTLYPVMQAAADALGGWRNLAMLALAVPLRGFLVGAAFGFLRFAWGAILAGRAIGSIGLLSAASGIARFGSAFLGLLKPMKLVRAGLFAIRLSIISTGIGALIVFIAMAGVWIYNNWSGLVTFFNAFGEAFLEALGPARPLAEGIMEIGRKIWEWIGAIVGPIDASADAWAGWGTAAGQAVGNVISLVFGLPGKIIDGLSAGWAGFTGWLGRMWSGLGTTAQVAWDGLKHLLLNYHPAGLIYTHWDGLAEYFSGLWDGIVSIFTEAWAVIQATVITPFTSAVNMLTDNKLTRGVSAARSGIADWWNGTPETPNQAGVAASGKAARAAAVAGALAVGGPLAAETPTADGSRYVNARSGSNTSISAPVTIEIKGNVDREVMPNLEELAERAADMVADRIHEEQRRGHG